MFTIDLLKGQGVPLKSSPGGIAITAVTIAIPLYVLLIMIGLYANDVSYMSVKEQEITRCQSEIDRLSDVVSQHESLEKQRVIYRNCLSEVSSSLGKYIQWSPSGQRARRSYHHTTELLSLTEHSQKTHQTAELVYSSPALLLVAS